MPSLIPKLYKLSKYEFDLLNSLLIEFESFTNLISDKTWDINPLTLAVCN